MSTRNRFVAWTLLLALPAGGCGGGQSNADREAVSRMLERLGRSRTVAECMAAELDSEYDAPDFQPLIDGRGDYTNVDLVLLEQIASAERKCTDDD